MLEFSRRQRYPQIPSSNNFIEGLPRTATETRKQDALKILDSYTKPPIVTGGKGVTETICSQLSFVDVSKV